MYPIHSGSADQDFLTELQEEVEEAVVEEVVEQDLQEQQETQMIEAMAQSYMAKNQLSSKEIALKRKLSCSNGPSTGYSMESKTL